MIGSLTRSSLANKKQYRSLLAGNEPVSYGAYELISTAYGTGSSGTITFSSIPQDFKHLQIRFAAASNTSANTTGLFTTLNGDSGANYSHHYLAGNGSSVFAGASASQTTLFSNEAKITGALESSIYMAGVLDLLDYASASKNKTARLLQGFPGSVKVIRLVSGARYNTAALTSLTFTAQAGSFTTASRFSLYGIKG